jgi:hypothetical protein
MSTFITTTKSNPCPICEKTNGNCRTFSDSENVLCMTFTDRLAQVPGFWFIGLTEDRLWGKWVPNDDPNLTQEQRDQWRQEQKRLRQQRIDAENQQRAESLVPKERNEFFRLLLDQLPLHPADRSDLHRRGLTDEQIEAVGFKSVEQWQKLSVELPFSLPGVSLDGKSLITPCPGYLCPIRDADNFIVGFQLRARNVEKRRYSWLTGRTKKRPNGPTPHLPNGELPLSVVKPEQIERDAIALVEGLGAKPIVLAQRLGLNTIGAAGGMFGASPETLRLTLEKLGCKVVEFYPDAGAVQNKDVLRQYRATFKLLKDWGYQVRVAWWGQEDKRVHPDIDELEDLGQIQYLSVAEFEAICAKFNRLLHKLQETLAKFAFPLSSCEGFGKGNEKKNQNTPPDRSQTLSQDHEIAGKLISNSRRGRRAFRRVTRLVTSTRRNQRVSILRVERHRKRLRVSAFRSANDSTRGLQYGSGDYRNKSL